MGGTVRNTRLLAGLVLAVVAIASVAFAALPPGGTFIDDDGHIFEGAIEAIAAEGITKGCNPPTNDRFCPNDKVTRGEMAVFLVRAMGYSNNGGGNLFVDDDGLFYENSADRLKTAKVTLGCNPPTNDKYCGERNVTRGEMAAFLVRAMGYKDNGGGNLFTDDDGHLFENAIDKLGTAKVTLGCNPPDNDHFCPDDFVTRGQMAAFLSRALGLSPIPVPPPAVPEFDLAWGSPGSGPGQFDSPVAVDVGADGSVYVADRDNLRVQRFSSTGAFVDSWGHFPSPPSSCPFCKQPRPQAIAVSPAGSVYVSNGFGFEIQQYTSDGTLVRSFGSGRSGPDGYISLDVAPDGTIYALTPRTTDQIVHFTAEGVFLNWWGNRGVTEHSFWGGGVAVGPDGVVYVSSQVRTVDGVKLLIDDRVLRFDADGAFIDSWHLKGGGGSQPGNLDVGPDNTIYVFDIPNARIQRLTFDGDFLGAWGQRGTDPEEFWGNIDITANDDTVFTVEDGSNRVQKFVYP